MNSLDFITIDSKSRKPKYLQIVDSIKTNIASGNLSVHEQLPSINDFSAELYLSRDTVQKAYAILKKQKLIISVHRKGYFINRVPLISKLNICFMVNKTSSYKMLIYNTFIATMAEKAHVDLFVYHCNETLFLDILKKNIGAYDYYVIMPHFTNSLLNHESTTDKVLEMMKLIPEDKLAILDNKKGEYNSKINIYQDFENDIYKALIEALAKIKKYNKLVLVYPTKSIYPYPKRILHGFRKFCIEHQIEFEIYDEIYDEMILKKGDLFLVIEESDLVTFLKKIRKIELKLGKDIGLISYNDTSLKDLLEVSVISTDFKKMGKTAANMILNKECGSVLNDFNLIIRKSL